MTVIHYHGTPITPRDQLPTMGGRCFCVSYAEPRDLGTCLSIGQSVMFDNGAFSAFTRGHAFDERGFYEWVEPHLGHPHWAVVPDVIDGTVDQQREMVKRWPFPREFGMPVWHLGLAIDYLLELADEWPRICFGSTAEYWQVGSPAWCSRMDEAFNALAKRSRHLPWVHGLRMLGMGGSEYPLASADSTNVARNWKTYHATPGAQADQIDRAQTPTRWTPRQLQASFI